MRKKIRKICIILVFAISIAIFLHIFGRLIFDHGYQYFPLNEGDRYIYRHREGPEEGIVTITVKNVKQLNSSKQFDFLFQGKYNDRIQTYRLTRTGLLFYRNKHLVGEVPMKVIREFFPPLLMLPYQLKKNIAFNAIEDVYDYDGKLIDKEKIEGGVSFVGFEEVNVEAGKFRCLHFFVRLNYEDYSGNSKHMHAYNFWVTPGLGYVKVSHAFVPFLYITYIKPEDKNIMNRYSEPFVETFELKAATIGTRIIGG